MVTSLLMTSASPVNHQSTMTRLDSDSENPSIEICNSSSSLLCNSDLPPALSHHEINASLSKYNRINSTSHLLINEQVSNHFQEVSTSDIPSKSYSSGTFSSSLFEDYDSTSSLPEYSTTQTPLMEDLVTSSVGVSVSTPENISFLELSQQWDGSQAYHSGTDALQSQKEYLISYPTRELKEPNRDDLELTTLKRNFVTDEIVIQDSHRKMIAPMDQHRTKDSIKDYINKDEKGTTTSMQSQDTKIFNSRHSKTRGQDETVSSRFRSESVNIADQEHLTESSTAPEGTSQDRNRILGKVDKMQVESLLREEGVVLNSEKTGHETVDGHSARSKLHDSHHRHRNSQDRHRRSHDHSSTVHITSSFKNVHTVHKGNQRKIRDSEVNDIKHIGIKDPGMHHEHAVLDDDVSKHKFKFEPRDHKHDIDKDHKKHEPQIHMKQPQEKGDHVILVRGVQEIEEEEEKHLLLLVVDRENSVPKHKQIKFHVHQHLNTFPPVSEEIPKVVKIKENVDQDTFSEISSNYQKDENLSLNGEPYLEELPLPQEQVMNNLDIETHQELREIKTEELEEEEGYLKEQQMEKVQQIYGGVEWESDRWEGGKILCQGAAFFTNLISAASALTVAVIAIDRYLAIVRPLVYGAMVTSGRCLLMLAWCWGQALLTALPPLLGWARYERRDPYGRCGIAWGNSPSYTAVWTISVFLIPFSIMVVCYYHILQVARNKCKKIRVGKMSETSPAVTPITSSTCLDGFPFPLSVEHLTSPPKGSKSPSPLAAGHIAGKISPLTNISSPHIGVGCHFSSRKNSSPPRSGLDSPSSVGNGLDPPMVRNASINGGLDSYLDKGVPCRSHSISGILRVTDTTNTSDSTNKPKRKLADFGRSRSLCQVPQQPPRPCLRRVQSTFSVRHTLKKLSLGTRRPSWNSEGNPSKGFWTVLVVMGAHILTWGPYTVMAVAEAILGRERLLLLPHWVTVTCTLLLFTASVFYPVVYGLYNRNIRKELLACLCPAWSRRRGSHIRRPSTVPSYSGSVLDFNALRQRGVLDKPEVCLNPSNGISGTIATISSTVGSLACPSPLLILAGGDDSIPARGYNFNHRKPSQDSGTVMVGGEDQDSDSEAIAPTPRQYTTRRVSAPSVLSTVREDPHTTAVCIEDVRHQVSRHHSMNSGPSSSQHRRLPIVPFSLQLLQSSPAAATSLRRSLSLDKIHSDDKDLALDSKITYRSLRKKRMSPLIRETQFSTPPASDRIQRRRGSIAVVKVVSIPEDSGLPEYNEVTDSGRGSVDSGNISRSRVGTGRGSMDSGDVAKTYSVRCRGSVDSTDLMRIQGLSRRGSVDSTELALAKSINKRHSGESVDLGKIPTTRQVSIDEGIGGDCLPEESANWE
ncbi:hypothetical protein SK128_006436 [Halocaridina rubra]|uniref:G-protein coupled receptors family 1 profile domain-containing protein n=1 Tax=Halocaridina rubra TaxID=373956 RepID=A0AAN9A0H3_HALRR